MTFVFVRADQVPPGHWHMDATGPVKEWYCADPACYARARTHTILDPCPTETTSPTSSLRPSWQRPSTRRSAELALLHRWLNDSPPRTSWLDSTGTWKEAPRGT